MLIIASHATQHTNDKQEVTPALENITASPEEALGSVTKFIADGIEAVQDEWDLVCMAWNIKRLHVLAKAI